MPAELPLTQILLDSASRIDQDILCVACSYNLRGLLPDQKCPECNCPIQPSLHGDRLQFTDPAWLARLLSGLNWIIAGFAAWLFNTIAFPWLMTWLFLGNITGWQILVYRSVHVLAGVIPVVGAWKVTSPEPRLRNIPWRVSARWIARWLLVASAAVLAAGHISLQARLYGPFWHVSLPDIVSIIAVPGWVALCIYLASLARRIPAVRLARATLVAMAGLILIEIVVLGATAASDWFRYDQVLGIRLLGPRYQLLLNLIQAFSWLAQQILLLLLAIFYRRRFRRQPQLSQAATQAPDVAPRRTPAQQNGTPTNP